MNVDQVSSKELEDDLIFLEKGRQPQFFRKMEDDLNFHGKWKTTSLFFIKMEDDLSFQVNKFEILSTITFLKFYDLLYD